MKLWRCPAFFLLLFGFGCTEVTTTSSSVFGEDVRVERRPIFRTGDDAPPETGGVSPGALQRGTDRFVNTDRPRSRVPSKAVVVPRDGEDIDVSLINASIAAAAKAVLGDALKQKFVVSDKVQGSITIQSTGPIPKDALLDLFEAALTANDAKLEKDGGIVRIVPGSSGSRRFRLASDDISDGAAIVVAPLTFISAKQMANLLEPLVDEGLTAVPDRSRNLLLLSGNQDQLESALDALNLFDVDVLAGKSVALVQLDSAEPDAIVDELRTIFETEEGEDLEGVIEFVPNARLGSVLIITSQSQYLSRAQRWIRQLDRTASGTRRYLQTYELQNRAAKDVAPILTDLLATEATSDSDAAPSNDSSDASRVAADEARNALIVRATRKDHREISRLIQEIDSIPQQVLLEATIAEVTLNDNLSAGVRWFFNSGDFGIRFSDLASGSTAGTNPGFSAVLGASGAEAALSALAGVTEVNIISSPTLVVLDNQAASLQIGDQVPIATRTSVDVTDTNSPVVTNIEYRDTGVILNVTPNINRNGRVVLEVEQEISDVANTSTSGIDSPTIRQRRVATNVLLNDGHTLALGGLIQESRNVTKTKVPGLGDVPVIGAAFRKTQVDKKRTELLILIRPRVMSSDDDAKRITDYYRTKVAGPNTIIQTGLGPPRHTIDDIFY